MLNCIHMYRLLIEKVLIYIRNDIEMPTIHYLPYISRGMCAIKKRFKNGEEIFILI